MPKFPVVAVGAIVVDDGDILLVKRKTEPAAGTWSLPGGRVELGESLLDATVREVKEETGLTVRPGAVAGTVERIVRDDEGGIAFHYVIVDLWATIVDRDDPTPGPDEEAAKWFAVEDLSGLRMAPGLFEFLRDQGALDETLRAT